MESGEYSLINQRFGSNASNDGCPFIDVFYTPMRNTRNLRERLTQLTTNKVSIPYSRLLDRNFVFKNFAQLITATAPERAGCFAISAEYATFAVTY